MGANSKKTSQNRLVATDRETQMRIFARAIRAIPRDSGFFSAIEEDPKVAREVGALLKEAATDFDAAHPGEARKRQTPQNWRAAGFEDIAALSEKLMLKTL